ncbi:hydrophobic surface binding protein A-domain-containing protein [Colletotrichum cereale]|nr:hydrophobic surface binding protein A-domain-containing protein [Colletotrichum cereale]
MQLTKTLLFALVGTAIAAPAEKRQVAIIQGAVTTVQTALAKLDTAVKGVTNDVASTQPVLAAATEAQNAIAKAGQDIQGAQPLQLQEALGLQQIAGDLQTSATTLIDDLISKKPNFDTLGVSSVVLKTLQDQKASTQALGTSIVSKIPAIGQTIAQQAIDQIGAVIDKGIQAYSTGAAKPAAAGAAPPSAKPGNGTTVPPAAAPATPKSPPATAPKTPPASTPKTPAAAPKAPAGGDIGSLLGGLLGGAGGKGGGAGGGAGLGNLLGGLTGGAAGGAGGGAGGIGALIGPLLGGLGGAKGGAAGGGGGAAGGAAGIGALIGPLLGGLGGKTGGAAPPKAKVVDVASEVEK